MHAYTISLNVYQTFGLSVLVLLFGRWLVNKVSFLSKFCIPAPVVGGLIFSLVNFLGYATNTFTFDMDMTLETIFMIMFFTTIGFSASLEVLKKGGVGVLIFLLVSSVLCIFQDGVGAGIAKLFGVNPLLGLAAGSISMTGGHGTSAAFGPLLEKAGLTGGTTLSIAAATFGLISGSLIGGPTAKRLIEKHHLKTSNDIAAQSNPDEVETSLGDAPAVPLNAKHVAEAFFQIGIAVGIGNVVSLLISKTGFTVPAYIGSMLVAAVMRNIFKPGKAFETRVEEISALGEVFLAIFLSQALMALKLWQLAAMALPLLSILLVQVVLMFLYAYYVTFFFMGHDYDAAVLAGGHCGFGMGATPNAMANMDAICEKYGPSPRAFFVLPLVGGLFIDFVNATIITIFINILK